MIGNEMKRGRAASISMALLAAMLLAAPLHAQESPEIRKYPAPFLLTAAGQTPDTLMVKIVSERAKLDFRYLALAKTSDLSGVKSLMVVMGVSMKGLGSAGIKLDEEVDRVSQLLADAKKKGIPVVGVFAGGAGGRGGRDQLTDSLLSQIAPTVDYLVVLRSGDKDGFFKDIAAKNRIPLIYMETIVDMNKVIPGIFN